MSIHISQRENDRTGQTMYREELIDSIQTIAFELHGLNIEFVDVALIEAMIAARENARVPDTYDSCAAAVAAALDALFSEQSS